MTTTERAWCNLHATILPATKIYFWGYLKSSKQLFPAKCQSEVHYRLFVMQHNPLLFVLKFGSSLTLTYLPCYPFFRVRKTQFLCQKNIDLSHINIITIDLVRLFVLERKKIFIWDRNMSFFSFKECIKLSPSNSMRYSCQRRITRKDFDSLTFYSTTWFECHFRKHTVRLSGI